MTHRLDLYLFLERVARQARERGDEEFAELVSDNVQPFWSALSDQERDELTGESSPETTALRTELVRLRDLLRKAEFERDDLLAVIHRDGGHYLGEHGVSKAVADAHATWAAMVARKERIEHDLREMRDSMRKAHPDDDVPCSSVASWLDEILSKW